MITHLRRPSAILLGSAMLLGAAAHAAPPVPPAQPAEKTIDPRIDPSRITESDPPPLPEQVVLPKPPEHRIAGSAEALPIDAEHDAKARAAIGRGLRWLREHQDSSGGWLTGHGAAPTDRPDARSPITIAVTALALKAMVQAEPESVNTPAFARAWELLRSARRDDGTWEGGALSNYVTASVASAMAAIDRNGLSDQLDVALTTLQETQWDEGEGLEPRQDWYGGAGYGGHGRPDLSNTQMMLEALYDAGLSPDEPAFQRAVAFLSRAQNLKATNPSAWAGDDGGFIYTPANGGESMASEAAGEGRYGEKMVAAGAPRSLRSYGSMTYAGFKSLLYAGLSADDVRVRAAYDWIRRNFTFEENPGLGQQGLYYYYHAMSRALRVAQQDHVVDINGVKHNWREELIDAIVKRQRDDGSWKNDAERWLEGEPAMATIDAVLALEEALKK